MAGYKLNIKRIEELITQYASDYGIDNNAQEMIAIKDKLNSKKFPEFYDILFLSCVLKVSPDYITGVCDNPEIDDPYLIKLLSNYIKLNSDCRYSLAEKSEQYLNIQKDFLNFDEAEIVVKKYDENGTLRIEENPFKNSEEHQVSMVAEPRAEYDKSTEE